MSGGYWGSSRSASAFSPAGASTRSNTPRNQSPEKLNRHAALAIDMAKSRLAVVESMGGLETARSVGSSSGWQTSRTSARDSARGTPRSTSPPNDFGTLRRAFSSVSVAGTQQRSCRSFHPRVELGLREKLAVEAQQVMEVADVSYLQAADLVAADERSCHDGVVNVHAENDLSSVCVAELIPRTRFTVCETCQLGEHGRRALIIYEGDSAPLGWVTAKTPDGIPLMHIYARPLYEVSSKKPLKMRRGFEQTSKYVRQLSMGQRLHVTESRRTTDGAQRVCAVVIGEGSETGWLTARMPNGRRMLREVAHSYGEPNPRPLPPSQTQNSVKGNPLDKYKSMSDDALDTAGKEFLGQQMKEDFIPAAQIEAERRRILADATKYEGRIEKLSRSVIDGHGGQKPLNVVLGELIRDQNISPMDFMKSAAANSSSASFKAKVSKMDFRMYLRVLLGHKDMLSDADGAKEIDALFPKMDTDDSGEVDVKEIKEAFAELESAIEKHEANVQAEYNHIAVHHSKAEQVEEVYAITHKAELAVSDFEAALKKRGCLQTSLGQKLTKGGVPMADVAASWESNGPVDKTEFRRNCEGMGFHPGPESDRLFDGMRRHVGAREDTIGGADLEQALKWLQTEASAARKNMRNCNIDVIETTKLVKPTQLEYKRLLEEWKQDDLDEAERLRKDAKSRAKHHTEDMKRAKLTREKTTSLAW